MSVYTISDLHLSFACSKPMNIFGDNWEDHAQHLSENWRAKIKEEDCVVIPGDISWGMTLDEVLPDLMFIEKLPGRKVISKGNHDYWWQTAKKLNEFKEEHNITTITFLHNNSMIYVGENGEETAICATRGWKCPGDPDFTDEDLKIYNRELIRLENSLKSGRKDNRDLLLFLHYPPFNIKREGSGFTRIIDNYVVRKCCYGHLHGKNSHKNAFNGNINGTEYLLISSDYLGFSPLKIL